MKKDRLAHLLTENDRNGERAIALFQALIAFIVFAFHVAAASKNQWQTFSPFLLSLTGLVLVTCVFRFQMARKIENNRGKLHLLSVLDGFLIFSIIASYSFIYDLPIGTSFKAPSIIFLMVYTAIRLLRFDPVSILIAGGTVITGWFALLGISVFQGSNLTTSYVGYIGSTDILVGAVLELATGYALIVIVLVIVTVYARRFLSNAAHIEDLADANYRAEDNIERLESIINSSIDGIVIVQMDGTILRVNPAIEKMFGYKTSELIGESAQILMSEENALTLRAAINDFVETQRSHLIGQSFESEGIDVNGQIIPIELSISEFHGGSERCFAGFIRNITERKLALNREKKALALFEEAVQAAMDAIIIIDERGDVVSLNPAAEEIFGYTLSELRGKNMGDFIVPEKFRSAHANGMNHYLKTGEGPVLNSRIEIEGLHKNGNLFDLELAIKDIEGPDGKLFIGYARDISQRKATEIELIASKENAEVANRAKASFLAMMSHEIRTPLNGVLGILGILQDEDLSPAQQRYVKTANTSGRALLTILNDVLDFSKLEAGKLEFESRPFLIDPLIDSVKSLISPSAAQKNLKVMTRINKDINEAYIGDPDRIRQILLNLATNAVKFTETGEVSITVGKSPKGKLPGTNAIRFKVQDTGLGISEDKHAELFAEFSTIDASYARKFGGTGLGLAISKALVNAMDGQVGFISKLGAGSTFWFDIPLESIDAKKVFVQEDGVPVKNASQGIDKRILVAEDNSTNQLVVTSHLEKLGATVEVVSNGLEAVEICTLKKYDMILMDVSMPEMDGLEATKLIKSGEGKNADTPIIALTAYALDEDRQRVMAAGMDGFMSKPVSRVDLARVISKYFAEHPQGKPGKKSKGPSMEKLLFDLNTLDPIVSDMDSESFAKLISEFKNDINKYLKSAIKAEKTNDFSMFEMATHGLKGVSGIFGASELFRVSDNLNTYCRAQQALPKPDEIENLKDLAKKVTLSADELGKLYTKQANTVHEE